MDAQNLADSTLANLAKAYKASSHIIASHPTLNSTLDHLIQRSASRASGCIARDLMVIATAIGNEKFGTHTKTALAKEVAFRDAMLAELRIYYLELPVVTEKKPWKT